MATKADFTEQEWQAVGEAPHLAAAAVMVAGASGFLGSIKEAFAAGQKVFAGSKDSNPLIRALAAEEEVKAMQERLRESLREHESREVKSWIAGEAVKRLRSAMWFLQEKAPGDADDYRRWVIELAESVANAAKEGGFLGFGGERVSEDEQRVLNEIRSALRPGGAAPGGLSS